MQTTKITKVDKSQVAGTSFSSYEVLSNPADRYIRQHELNRALKLGNNYKHPVKIDFVDAGGQIQETEATVWAVTEKFVMVKGGHCIPIRSIFKVIP